MGEWMYDVVIIGGGVIGCAIARELSAYQLHTCLIEREEDVCSGTSKANSAIVHAGYDAVPGTWKARLNAEGNRMMGPLSEELDFDFKRCGSLVLCFHEEDLPSLTKLFERGLENGVPGLEILTGEAVRKMEPNLTEAVTAALYAPTGGIVCPFGLTIALAENACENGVEFRRNTEVLQVTAKAGGYQIHTSEGIIDSRFVVNAAGVYADRFHNMVSSRKLQIQARKGEYLLLDKEAGNYVNHTVFQLPGKLGKGILVTPTVHGNLLIGPTAGGTDDREETSTTASGLSEVIEKSALGVAGVPYRQAITSFTGLRAHEQGDDFVIEEAEGAEGFFDAAGIESPGLSCAPAIGKLMADMVAQKAEASLKPEFCGKRTGPIRPDRLSAADRNRLIQEQPAYGTIVCRCENVSEGEILDAIRRPMGAVSLDGIKRRVRAGMGRCQAGFCTPRTMELLSGELQVPMEDICKNRAGSEMLAGRK